MFPIIDVTGWEADEVDEQLGTKEKRWLIENDRWLFKEVRLGPDGPRGEDWAEKIVEQLGLRLGLPMAQVELAVWKQARGIVSRSFVPPGRRLEHGNELLVRLDPEYDRDRGRRNERYTVAAVHAALSGVRPPRAYDIEGLMAFDIWAGYVLLDAWVAGRDRHHENWGVLAGGDQQPELAPSFDHGNALGFQETEERHEALTYDPRSLTTWSRRGKSHHFAGGPSLVQVALDARALMTVTKKDVWMSRLVGLDDSVVDDVLGEVPSAIMSVGARTFCGKLLALNKRRIVDGD